jgi:hypothetical protein
VGRHKRLRRFRKKEEEVNVTTVGDIFATKIGEQYGLKPVLAWQDILKMSGPEGQAELANACKAMWISVAGRAQSGDGAFRPAALAYTAFGKAILAEPGHGVRDGWRWEGVMTGVYVDRWNSLFGKFGQRSDVRDPVADSAGMFRLRTSTFLKSTQNMVNISHGGNGNTPVWFIASEWNPEPATIPARTKPADEPAAQQRAEQKLTPGEAGETRQPAAVVRKYACREVPCKERFDTQRERNIHELRHAAPAGEFPCRGPGCQIRYQSQIGRKSHELNQHPEILDEYYPLRCPAPGCNGRFSASNPQKSLRSHFGDGYHSFDRAQRDALVEHVLTGEPLRGFQWTANGLGNVASTTSTETAGKSVRVTTQPGGGSQAVVVGSTTAKPRLSKPGKQTQAGVEDTQRVSQSRAAVAAITPAPEFDAETAAIAYLTGIIQRADDAEAEVARLREQAAALEEDARLGRKFRTFMQQDSE